MQATVGESLRVGNAALHGCRIGKAVIADSQCPQQRLGDAAALGLPRIALAKVSTMADQHEQRNAVELGEGDNAVDAGQEPMVLHQHG